MNVIEETIEATLEANGQLRLTHAPRLPPGPVRVTIRESHIADASALVPCWHHVARPSLHHPAAPRPHAREARYDHQSCPEPDARTFNP